MTARTERLLLNVAMGILLLFFLAYTISLFDDPACEGGYCTMYFFTHSLPLVFLWLATMLGINLWLNRNQTCLIIFAAGIPVNWMMVKAEWVISEGLTSPFKLLVALNAIFLMLFIFRKRNRVIKTFS